MKHLTISIIYVATIATFLFAGCDSDTIVQQDNTPPPISQELRAKNKASNNQHTKIIDGEYIIIFENQFENKISENIGREVDQLRSSVLSSVAIAEDSVLNSYKYAIKGFAAKLSDRQLKALKNDPRIRSVTPNALFKLDYRTNITGSFISSKIDVVKSSLLFNSQILPWGVARVGGPLNGIGKIAWILDSGIDLDHPDLNVDVNNSASFIAAESADDQVGHGTHVAGIIAAKNNTRDVVGVAAGATVVAIKVCNSLPPSDPNSGCPVSSIINGVDYTAIRAQTGDIVNMSLGGYDPNNNYTSIDDAVINAANTGIRFSISAGNDSQNAQNYTPARVEHSNVWTVSAFDNQDKFASFSNYGNPPIDYSGPGVDVPSLWKNGGTNTIGGTSMAAPHIAGLLLTVPNDISIDGYVTNDPDNNPDKIAAYLPFSATVTGPTLLEHGASNIWTAVPVNGSGGYSYQWYYKDNLSDPWTATGTNSSTHSRAFFNESGAIKKVGIRVDITSAGDTETGTIFPSVSPGGPGCEPHVLLC